MCYKSRRNPQAILTERRDWGKWTGNKHCPFPWGERMTKSGGERLGVWASCVVLVPVRSLMRSEEERKRREERETEKADLKYR